MVACLGHDHDPARKDAGAALSRLGVNSEQNHPMVRMIEAQNAEVETGDWEPWSFAG